MYQLERHWPVPTLRIVYTDLKTLTFYMVKYKGTKGEGSDHRGEFRIGQRRDQVKLQYTMGEVDLQDSLRNLHNNEVRRMASVSVLVATVAMQMQTITTPFN